MPITIGNGFLKSEILTNSPRNTKEAWWKVLWEKIKDFFFLLAKQKRTVVYMRCCLPNAPHTRAAYRDFF
ncbi:hypothetical protein N4X53_003382 [Salmonella enterica]|nr:hypothetical protein [Salmonella enterica]ECH8269707.1 hypothetical protein [Salmonella enterica subsp. enterica]EDO5574431.1 hypothetical protein [Salmonella enterica subsp. enterica serovar Bareilly]EAY4799632.1 hypothetical protein [Salmonella enterica]EBE2787243.1 hypothetical protein [Salmonella enterica]